jgi:hypothetical protein
MSSANVVVANAAPLKIGTFIREAFPFQRHLVAFGA